MTTILTVIVSLCVGIIIGIVLSGSVIKELQRVEAEVKTEIRKISDAIAKKI